MTVLTFPRTGPRSTAPAATATWEEFVKAALRSDWRPGEWDTATLTFTGDPGNDTTAVALCQTPSCDTIVDGGMSVRCSSCKRQIPRWPSVQVFERDYVPKPELRRVVHVHTFNLSKLRPRVRDELLYALQQRDTEVRGLRPSTVSKASKLLIGAESVLDVRPENGRGLTKSLLHAVQLHVRRLRAAYSGRDGTEGDVWDCALVGLRARPNRPGLATSGTVDFTVIRQRWLRDIALETARATRPPVVDLRRIVQAAEIASLALASRPSGNDPGQLALADMTIVFQYFANAIDPVTQLPYSITHRRALLGWWRRLISFGRSAGLMDAIPGAFTLTPAHSIPSEEINEDEHGRAIPEAWITHLDLHLPLLGTVDFKGSDWSTEDYAHMYQTIYGILRDTGRRTGEVVALDRECVEYDGTIPVLIYDNFKARRRGRRLPVDPATAALIASWVKRLESLPVPKACAKNLFPTPGARNRERRGHIGAGQFGKHFRRWVDAVPAPTNLPPEAQTFAPADIEPYGLRHAYAQRHADNGTPVDVLKELMDHKDINTTMGYYKVSMRRKHDAVRTMSKYATDRFGNPAPFADGLAYERSSVAVPFGNCTEPQNVRAGGKACAIRFQCAGCGFFRPDPSFLDPLESHISELRADKEIAAAGDADDWVLRNFDDQIRAFTRITQKMQERLDALPDDERSGVAEACSTMNKVRQSAAFVPVAELRMRPRDE